MLITQILFPGQIAVYNLFCYQMLVDKGHGHAPHMDLCSSITGTVW